VEELAQDNEDQVLIHQRASASHHFHSPHMHHLSASAGNVGAALGDGKSDSMLEGEIEIAGVMPILWPIRLCSLLPGKLVCLCRNLNLCLCL